MILVGQYDSPYTRRVAVSLHVLGFDFEHDTRSVFGDFDSLRTTNPLGRVPSLVLADGTTLIDFGGDPGLAGPAGRTAARVAATRRPRAPAGVAAHRARDRHDRQGHGRRLRTADPAGSLSLAGLDHALPHPGGRRNRGPGRTSVAGRCTTGSGLYHDGLHGRLCPPCRPGPAAARPSSVARCAVPALRGAAAVSGRLSC